MGNRVEFKVMTTGQKAMLENILEALDISLTDFMEIVNLKSTLQEFREYKNQTESRLSLLETATSNLNVFFTELNVKVQKIEDGIFGIGGDDTNG